MLSQIQEFILLHYLKTDKDSIRRGDWYLKGNDFFNETFRRVLIILHIIQSDWKATKKKKKKKKKKKHVS